jgi:D-alanyl-D-alanine carboxypeptidase/D-alanyl-D-alanine-endopeptidase (penicillin-binding protein 4)
VLKEFLLGANIDSRGMFIEDGSGLSPRNSINSEGLTDFLIFMKRRGKYFSEYFASLPEAGKEGTLKSYFRDPAFESNMRAKSGSMERVRCYAGYLNTASDNSLAFSILINNYSGSATELIPGIEELLKEVILYK